MAAKQGLTAQIYQASEDTKRSLLSRAPTSIKSHSWLSNLNTTCTIKSAPPRTPEVMSLLSTKCGWLAKRNEQHVWQKRWCCVVPHTFLYYFEASPRVDEEGVQCQEGWSGGGVNPHYASGQYGTVAASPAFQNLDQDALNLAVREGLEDDRAGATRGSAFYASLPHFSVGVPGASPASGDGLGGDDNAVLNVGSPDWEEGPVAANGHAEGPHRPSIPPGTYPFVGSSNLQPVGIIDLECYSAVHRSKINPTVLELAGDAITNPDLRSFYFQSANVEDAEAWIKALLADRHQSLKDETDAYRQVCDSFPLQLQACSDMIDAAEAKADEMEREAYSARSLAEEGRRRVVDAVREVLERRSWDTKERERGAGGGSGSGRRTKSKSQRGKRDNGRSAYGDDFSVSGMESIGSGALDRERDDDHHHGHNHNPNRADAPDSQPVDSVLDAQYAKLETNRAAFLQELESTLASSSVAASNVLPPVQTLVDYTSAIVASFEDLRFQLRTYERDLRRSVQRDRSRLEAFETAMEEKDALLAEAEQMHGRQTSELKSQLESSHRQVEELSKQLDAHRMEFGMYQNATKTKLSELQQHKKILKREVIDLRKKIDECGSENTTVAHEYEKIKTSYQAEKERNATLERYIDRLEKQVGVQQNMMEIMSQTGGASFVGKMVGPGVTQNDSMSVGSHQLRRMTSDLGSVGGGSQMMLSNNNATANVETPTKPRLPPGSSNNSKSNHRMQIQDVSPLHTPQQCDTSENETAGPKNHPQEDYSDAADGFYQSDNSVESGAPAEGGNTDASPSGQQMNESHDDDAITSSFDGISVPSAGRLAEDKITDPKSPQEANILPSVPAEPVKTPVQSNSNNSVTTASILNTVMNKGNVSFTQQSIQMPKITNVGVEEPVENRMKIVSINDGLLSSSTLPTPDADRDEEDMDDNKSRVSDITEDRTQRQIDDDLAERRKILLAYVSNATGGTSSSSVSLSMSSTQRRLDTIENIMPNNTNSNNNNANNAKNGESRRGGMQRVDSQGDMASHGSGGSRLSVAQRARLEADAKSNTHRSASPMKPRDDVSLSSNNNNKSRTNGNHANVIHNQSSFRSSSSVGDRSSHGETLEQSNSFFSKLGKVIESAVDKSVLGVKTPTSDDGFSDYDDTASETMSTLQERIAKQRETQLAFLKQKGLLDDERSLRGGAGGSVTGSPNLSTPRRTVGRRRM
mmetsp:Transcript_8207/g.16695  ORF Transcript_8207/g.16695 Transcript_8207/m.16695 type:complete len:1207 (+) Transcript_8207:191-3811(+)